MRIHSENRTNKQRTAARLALVKEYRATISELIRTGDEKEQAAFVNRVIRRGIEYSEKTVSSDIWRMIKRTYQNNINLVETEAKPIYSYRDVRISSDNKTVIKVTYTPQGETAEKELELSAEQLVGLLDLHKLGEYIHNFPIIYEEDTESNVPSLPPDFSTTNPYNGVPREAITFDKSPLITFTKTSNKLKEMATLSDHHRELSENGEGKCSVPMWQGGYPAGFCDQPAYGPRIDKDIYDGYVPALACPSHGGRIDNPKSINNDTN